MSVHGHCDSRFRDLSDLLARRIATGAATGEAIAVVIDGVAVVDIYAGAADPGPGRPWAPDTLACLFSASKPLAAVAVLRLVDAGRVQLDAPVASYWPEFAQAGKDMVTVRHALAHLAGIPIAESVPDRAVYEPTILAEAVARQAPLWSPGTQGCFHSFTYGIIVAEVLRRVDGRALPQFFAEEMARPLGLDLHFGLGPNDQARCAELILVPDNPLLQLMTDPATELGRSWRSMPWGELNSPAFRASGFASLAGHGSALGLASFYAFMANGGAMNGKRMLSEEIAAEAISVQWHQVDAFMGAPVRMGLGFMLAGGFLPLTGGVRAFAQPGLGGVAGIGDPDLKIGIAILPNLLSGGLDPADMQAVLDIVVAGA